MVHVSRHALSKQDPPIAAVFIFFLLLSASEIAPFISSSDLIWIASCYNLFLFIVLGVYGSMDYSIGGGIGKL